MRRGVIVVVCVLGLSACDSQQEALSPGSPQAALTTDAKLKTPLAVTPTSLVFTVLGVDQAETLTVTVRSGGKLTASTSPQCEGVATVSPNETRVDRRHGTFFVVTPVGTGACRVVVADKKGNAANVEVLVDTTPPPSLYDYWTPIALNPSEGGTATLTLESPTVITAARVVLQTGGTVDLVRRSTHRWTVTLPVTDLLAGYTPGDAHQFVGFLDLYDGGTRTLRHNVFVNVRDLTMPDVAVSTITPDLQSSPHVVNLRFDSLSSGYADPVTPLQRLYQAFPDAFDFLAVVSQVNYYANRTYHRVKNDIAGLGLQDFDYTATYGSAGRLQGIITYPISSYFDLGETGSVHEIGHRWMAYLSTPSLASTVYHWPLSDIAYGIMGMSQGLDNQGVAFPFEIVPQPGGDYLLRCIEPAREYNDLELYLMGLLPKDSVGTHFVFTDQTQTPTCGGLLHGPVQTLTIADVIASDGERPPASQRSFAIATLVLSRGRLLSQDEMAFFDHMAERGEERVELPFTSGFSRGMTKPFYLATGGRATLVTQVQ